MDEKDIEWKRVVEKKDRDETSDRLRRHRTEKSDRL